MNRVVVGAPLPVHPGAGPHAPFLSSLVVAVRRMVAELSYRLNMTAPKDGSELQQMTSYDAVDFPTVTGDVDDADVGYYTIAKFALTGGDHSLTGIANGAGPEGAGGRFLLVMNVSAGSDKLLLQHGDVGSDVENRLLLPYATIAVGQNSAVQLWYDLAALRWRLA